MDVKCVDYKKLGGILKSSRENAGYTQKKIADILGVKYQTVSAWENAKSKVDIDTLFFLCKKYEIDFNETLAMVSSKSKDVKAPFSFDEVQHIKKYRILDDHGRGLVDMVTEKEYERCLGFVSAGPSEEAATYDIPLVGTTAAGSPIGYGDPSYDVVQVERIPKGAEFSLLVQGKSMEPEIRDGSIVFIKPQPIAENGEIVVAEINGEVTCKKFHINYDGQVEFLSLNPEYGPIEGFEDYRIIGKVVF